MSNVMHCLPWKNRCLLGGLLIAVLSGAAWAETPTQAAATTPLTPEMQQQLFDAQKKVLEAEAKLLATQEKHIEEKNKLFEEKESEVVRYTSVGTFLGLMLGLFGGWGFIARQAKTWVAERVESEINNNMKHLSRIVDNSRLETRLKDEKRVLVLYGNDSANLDSLLRKFRFVNTEAMPCPVNPNDVEWDKWDEVVFDNIDKDLLKSYLDSGRKSWYLAYKTGGQYPNELVHGTTLTLANNQVTLYPRLMELLIWRHSQESKAA